MKSVNALVLVLALACAPDLLAQEGGSDCLVASQAGRLADGVWAIEPARADGRDRIQIGCRAGQVSDVSIRLAPGSRVQVRILLVGDWDQVIASLAAEGGLPEGWGSLSARRIDTRATRLTLSFTAPDHFEAGSMYSDRLSVTSAELELDIPISLEIVGGGPLFRDGFGPGPDPIMGQFSLAP